LATFNYSTYLLAAARDRNLLSLESVVNKLTDVPARLYGLKDRGRIEQGWCADLVIFDANTVAPDEVEVREDLPGGAWRLYSEAVGVHHVFINGKQAVLNGQFTDARPGTLLRAGRDTEPVTATS